MISVTLKGPRRKVAAMLQELTKRRDILPRIKSSQVTCTCGHAQALHIDVAGRPNETECCGTLSGEDTVRGMARKFDCRCRRYTEKRK